MLPECVHALTRSSRSLRLFMEYAPRNCHTFIDLGSGVGNLLLVASMLRPRWDIHGIEYLEARYRCGEQYKLFATFLCQHWGLRPPRYRTYFGSITKSEEIASSMMPRDQTPVMIFVNSFAWRESK
jgi:hypothetical protein